MLIEHWLTFSFIQICHAEPYLFKTWTY